jgi:hypothetical protein
VVRDGYLLYYPESERREFEKQNLLNLHPKVASNMFIVEENLGEDSMLDSRNFDMVITT